MILNEIIDNYLVRLNELKVIKECYEIRLHLIKANYALKDEYEKNEVDILRTKTIHTINKLTQEISVCNKVFAETSGRMIEELEFQEKNIE